MIRILRKPDYLPGGDLLSPAEPGEGFGIQRVYTDDGTLDETMAVGNRDAVLVPRGHHPRGAPHGFEILYSARIRARSLARAAPASQAVRFHEYAMTIVERFAARAIDRTNRMNAASLVGALRLWPERANVQCKIHGALIDSDPWLRRPAS
jgi:hypothetical protein